MLRVTQGAIDQLKQLKMEYIRIILKGCGCAGPAFELSEGRAEGGEHTKEVDELSFAIDPNHEALFKSMVIDFADGEKGGFLINVQGGKTGGCGSCCGCTETDRLNQPIMPVARGGTL